MEYLHKTLGKLSLADPIQAATSPLLEPGLIVRLRCHNGRYLKVHPNKTVELGSLGAGTHFRTSEAPNHHIRFESVVNPGLFLGIDPGADKMAGGAGGAGCHFKTHIIEAGVVALQHASGGFCGIDDQGNPKPPSKTKTGKHGRFVVEAIIDPAMIGVKPGCIIRFQHTNGFLRDNDGRIDAKGDPRDEGGAKTFWKANIASGNVTLQNEATHKFLAFSADFSPVPSDQPAFFSLFFTSANGGQVSLMGNAPPNHNCIGVTDAGDAAPYNKIPMSGAIFSLHANLLPIFYGLTAGNSRFSFEAPNGKFLRAKDDKSVDVNGGNGGPKTIMSFVVHQQNANAIAIINQATGGALRAADAHTVDAKAAPTGPNAQLHIYNLGGGHVAIHTPSGFVNHDGKIAAKPTKTHCGFKLHHN